jgi:hypothetical protein
MTTTCENRGQHGTGEIGTQSGKCLTTQDATGHEKKCERC